MKIFEKTGDLLARIPRPYKLVLLIKIIGIVAVLGSSSALVDFGELAIFAAKKEPSSAADDKSSEKKKVEATAGPEAQQKTRKSFLSDLLELPEIDKATPKKEELGKYLEIAERKDRQITERLSLLKKKEEQLKVLEKSIETKLVTLDEERKYFAQTIQQEKNLKNERVNQLVTLYAKMEPKKAAPVLEKLDKDLVVELFKQLPQKQITAILEVMNPERSVFLSEYYGRVRSAREYDLLKEMNQSLRKEFDECKGLGGAQK